MVIVDQLCHFLTHFHFFSRCTEDFEILHGDFQGLSDTMSFLNCLVELNNVSDSEKNNEKRQMREHKAAAGLFNWEVMLIPTKICSFYIFFFCILHIPT